jgi:hypothetical protein
MEVDDPRKPEFASWESYRRFEQRVRHQRRYILTPEQTAFLETVRKTIRDRDVRLQKGKMLHRAQLGTDWEEDRNGKGEVIGGIQLGYSAERMKPRPFQSKEGRVNPAGIPVLYLAITEQTAISEVRPWIGRDVSVAQFKIQRDLKGINLSVGHSNRSFDHLTLDELVGEKEPDAQAKEKAVWTDIDNAFSRPVTPSDDATDYVPTQILAELFRNAGYEFVVYKSQFGEKGYSVVLFNVADAEVVNCAPYVVTEIEVKFRETGPRWYSQKIGSFNKPNVLEWLSLLQPAIEASPIADDKRQDFMTDLQLIRAIMQGSSVDLGLVEKLAKRMWSTVEVLGIPVTASILSSYAKLGLSVP